MMSSSLTRGTSYSCTLLRCKSRTIMSMDKLITHLTITQEMYNRVQLLKPWLD